VLQLGQRLGEFEIVRLLGKGGMGEVYEAQQFDPFRRVALKVLAPALCQNEEGLRRFWREADVLARLDHPGIVRVLTRGRDAATGTAYYTMQLIRGASLARVFKEGLAAAPGTPEPRTPQQPTIADPRNVEETGQRRTTPHPVRPPLLQPAPEEPPADVLRPYREDRCGFVVRVGIQAAKALAAAHQEGVLHRDLKPSNMMLDRHGHVYLVDFGLARVLDAPEMTQSGLVRGTPGYMSPEQAAGRALDDRSDVYSLGVTLCELAAGRRLPDPVAAPGESLPPDTPDGLVRILAKAMQLEPEQRYPSASAMLADLEQLAAGQTPRPAAEPPRPPRRWMVRALAGAALAVCVLAAALAAWALWPAPREESPAEREYFPWPDNPLPAVRQRRTLREALPLLRAERFEPIWSLRLQGDRDWHRAARSELCVQNMQTSMPTVVLLDYDPKFSWYLYDVKVHQPLLLPGKGQVGTLFGYRRNRADPGKHYPCLATQLVEGPRGAAGSRFLVGTLYVEEKVAGRAPKFEGFLPFTRPWGELSLPPRAPGQGPRRIQTRAVDDRVTIQVDQGPTLTLDLPAVRKAHPLRNDLDPRGGVGLWVNDGIGFFSDASVTPLPSDRTSP
jgi:serine/threonine protein kinase